MEKMITIGRLSKITGVSARSIRHYEKIGLLTCPANTDSNYRLYGKEEIRKLQDIALLRSLDFSLGEIAEIVNADENIQLSNLFEERLLMLNKEIAKLQRSKDILTAVTTLYKTQGLQNINNFHIIKEMVTIFTFEDISLLPDDTIRKWLSLCDDDELCIVLEDSGNYLKSKILNNMSEERARRLKKMMDSQDAVSLDQEYLAMNHLLEILQKTEEDNKITLERF